MGLPKTTGFDLDAVIQRLRGNQSRILELFHRFAANTVNVHREMETHIHQNALDDTRLLAHQIEGSAANLGAIALADSAGNLEKCLQHCLQQCNEHLQPTILKPFFAELIQLQGYDNKRRNTEHNVYVPPLT